MNTFLLIFSILFTIAGVTMGIRENDISKIAIGIIGGLFLFAYRLNRIKNKELIEQKKTARKQAKNEARRYEYYLTDEGKKVLMPYLTEEELETYSWETLAHTYASETGQKILHDRLVEEQEQEEE